MDGRGRSLPIGATTVVLCAGAMLALGPLACASNEAGSGARMRVSDGGTWGVSVVEFLDASGAVRRRIETSSAWREEPNELHFEAVHVAASAGAAVVTRAHIAGSHGSTVIANTVTLYDTDGTPLFERHGLDYVCFQVSAGGETVVCMAEEFEHEEPFAYPGGAPREVEVIVVLGRDGSERARFEHWNGSVLGTELRLSPNGRWLAYPAREARDWATPKVVLLRDLRGGDGIRIPGVESVGTVNDDGDLLRARPGSLPGEEAEVVWRRPRGDTAPR